MLLVPSGVEAFDGNRKGFVVGIGAGVAPVAKWSRSFGINETQSGFAFNLVVGHGLSSKDLVVWSALGATNTSDVFVNQVVQGISSFQWYHFLSNQDQSFYTSIGIGVMVFQPDRGTTRQGGIGFKGELGYEVEKHLLIGTYGILGQTNRRGSTLTHKQFGILLRLLAY